MTLQKRHQLAARLCCHCLRNIAYYRAWWEAGQPHVDRDFWVTTNGNAIDVAVLEWCKLFTEWDGSFHFRKLVRNRVQFRDAMLKAIGVSENHWAKSKASMKNYRDTYVAHWDGNKLGSTIPVLCVAKASAIYLLDYLGQQYKDDPDWPAPRDGAAFYKESEEHATQQF